VNNAKFFILTLFIFVYYLWASNILMRTISLLLFLLLCQSAIGFSQTVIQMKKEGGVSVIPCKVNGLNLSFVFDTGAADVSISMTEALFMLKNDYLSKDDIKGTNKYSDATGGISEGIVINLKEIDIAGFKLYNVAASIVKNSEAPLLLGQSAIKRLGKFQLDLVANTLTITGTKNTYDASNAPYPKPKKTAPIIDNTPQYMPRNNTTSSVIGTPIKIGNLEIAQHNLPTKMTWSEAKSACAALGYGWRLPTKEELNELYKHKDEIGGFAAAYYWSSSEGNTSNAWIQFFSNGVQASDGKNYTSYVRAVRAF
jgi:clan AA aspartic protease (TIGR02281 family)